MKEESAYSHTGWKLRGCGFMWRGRKKRLCLLMVSTFLILLWIILIFLMYTGFLLVHSSLKQLSYSDQELILQALPVHFRPLLPPPDFLPSHIHPNTKKEEQEYKEGLDRYGFNKFKSDRLPWHRPLPDFRDSQCLNIIPSPLHSQNTASIVIIFVNEAFSVLMRTLTSIIRTSPKHLLKEIIMVDDASDDPTGELTNLTSTIRLYFPLVTLVRHSSRKGLMQARLTGAMKASGDVLVFFDSHIECMEGWLDPLLIRIANRPSTVVCPVIDIISWKEMELLGTKGTLELQGSFSWSMEFRWRGISKASKALRHSPTDPIRSETMAGGLFAIRRKFFFDIGGYDEGMNIWGAENLEMSFRVWMCGGELEILPCSRVAHIFRERHASYSFPLGSSETITKNTLRTVHVWLDEYKQEYFKRRPYNRNLNFGDISDRLALRERLKCKSFEWYLTNIASEILVSGKNVLGDGPIKNRHTSKCLDTGGRSSGVVNMYGCDPESPNQYILWTNRKEIVWDDDVCFDVSDYSPGTSVMLYRCHGLGGNQLFSYNSQSHTFKHDMSDNCLTVKDKYLIINKCDSTSAYQRWEFMKTYF